MKSETTATKKAKDSASEAKKPERSGSDSEAKGTKPAARPVSYFSSVRTDEYRTGWDSVFGKSDRHQGQHGIELSISLEELSARERKLLTDAFRRKAKSRNIDFDKVSHGAEVYWNLRCRIER